MENNYSIGDKVHILSGRYEGRIGKIKKFASSVFPEWVTISVDMAKRERVEKTTFIEYTNIKKL